MNEDTSSAHEKLRLVDLIRESGGRINVDLCTTITGWAGLNNKQPMCYSYPHWTKAEMVYSDTDSAFYAHEKSGSLAKCFVLAYADGKIRSNAYGYKEWRITDE
jgi:hypothetical protein